MTHQEKRAWIMLVVAVLGSAAKIGMYRGTFPQW